MTFKSTKFIWFTKHLSFNPQSTHQLICTGIYYSFIQEILIRFLLHIRRGTKFWGRRGSQSSIIIPSFLSKGLKMSWKKAKTESGKVLWKHWMMCKTMVFQRTFIWLKRKDVDSVEKKCITMRHFKWGVNQEVQWVLERKCCTEASQMR